MREVFSGETVSQQVKLSWSKEIIDTALLPDGVREFEHEGKYYYLNVQNNPLPGRDELQRWKKEWEGFFGKPADTYVYEKKRTLVKKFAACGLTGELYHISNGPDGRFEPAMLLLPEKGKAPYPVVIMPFYYPANVLGFDPLTGVVSDESGRKPGSWSRGAALARAGFAVLTCTSYYRTYINNDMPEDFTRWQYAAEMLLKDNPDWSGAGKLVYDNQLLVDFAVEDPRLDSERIGVMGHSLGGKIAFYMNYFEPRIKAVVASDFGMGWHQTNWSDLWYWGDKLKAMEEKNMEHSQLLALSNHPLLVIAGHYDNEGTTAFFERAKALGNGCELLLDNHADGHWIPPESFDNAIKFLRKHLNIKDI